MSEVSSRDDWCFDVSCDSFGSKERIQKMYVKKILIRTQQMFHYENLPETIPQKDLELLLQMNGNATICRADDGKLYAFRGGLGGVPNPYYLPTISIVSNPALRFNKTLEIDKDCVVILNDALYEGLMPLINHNAYLLAECDISLKFSAINTRIPALISAPDDTTKLEAEAFFDQVEKGEKLGVIADQSFFKNISVYNYANSSTLVQHLIELKQYIMGTFYHDLGIESSFNMKREAINESESALNHDILYPTIDDMLEQRKLGVEKINKMFGTEITVELSSVWKQLREQQDLELAIKESEIKSKEEPEKVETEVIENAEQ